MAKGILKYKMVTRLNPHDKSEQPKWYAKSVQDRTIEFEDLVTHMSKHNSPYSRGVIHGVLTDMLDCLPIPAHRNRRIPCASFYKG